MARLATVLALATLVVGGRALAASGPVDFARCLGRAGAVFYTADWCPHCRRQSQMFGDALRYLRVVDCSDGCDGITTLPTWRFRDGSRSSGVASFELLASRTGCALDGARRSEPDERGAPERSEGAGRDRYIGGARIIDVR